MTDKEKIREVIEKRYKYWKEKEFNSHSIESEIRMSECQHLLLMIDSLQEEPVSGVWHDASKEPNDMSHCLIFYGDKNDVGHYLHYKPVLYNHQEKVFVTESFPHPTGYKVEQKSIDGGCVAEVYKNKRDRISISDITQWCYLKDLHNLSNIERTVKDWKEEPIIEVLDRYLDRVPDEEVLKTKIAINEWFNVYFPKLQEEPVSEDLDIGKGEKNRSTKEDCLGCDRLRIVDFKKTDGEIVQVYMCVGLLDIPCPKGYG